MQNEASRCPAHPGTEAVAVCSKCGIGLCLDCAIPVRGKVLGRECLPEPLRFNAPPPEPEKRRRMCLPWTGVGLTIAVAASVLPWKKYGIGSGSFGAWGLTPRWSILAGAAAVLGLVVWAVFCVARLKPGPRCRSTMRVVILLAAAGTVLHLVYRPGFGPHSIGPWVALAGLALAFAGTLPLRLPRQLLVKGAGS